MRGNLIELQKMCKDKQLENQRDCHDSAFAESRNDGKNTRLPHFVILKGEARSIHFFVIDSASFLIAKKKGNPLPHPKNK